MPHDSKCNVQSFEENLMVQGIKGSQQIQLRENRNSFSVSIRKWLVGNIKQSSFSGVILYKLTHMCQANHWKQGDADAWTSWEA